MRREPGRVNMLRATTREQMRWVTSGVQSRGFADNGGSDRPTSRGDNRLSRMVQFKAGSLRRWKEGSMLRDWVLVSTVCYFRSLYLLQTLVFDPDTMLLRIVLSKSQGCQ